MEALLSKLEDLHPEIDYETYDTLLEDNILDEDDLEDLIGWIAREYDVQVPEEEITEENFNSAESIYDMIEKLQNEG